MKQDKNLNQSGKTSTSTTGMGTSAGSKGGNSISFGNTEYLTGEHVLRTQVKQGANSIILSINEDVLTELYNCSANERELKATFTEHQPEISRALLAKIANKQWKVANKEIVLNVQDLR